MRRTVGARGEGEGRRMPAPGPADLASGLRTSRVRPRIEAPNGVTPAPFGGAPSSLPNLHGAILRDRFLTPAPSGRP